MVGKGEVREVVCGGWVCEGEEDDDVDGTLRVEVEAMDTDIFLVLLDGAAPVADRRPTVALPRKAVLLVLEGVRGAVGEGARFMTLVGGLAWELVAADAILPALMLSEATLLAVLSSPSRSSN